MIAPRQIQVALLMVFKVLNDLAPDSRLILYVSVSAVRQAMS